MNKIAKIIAATALLLVAKVNAGCAFPIYQYGTHYYAHITEKMTWDAAKTYAMSQGGYLAVPNDANENGFFVSKGWKEDWIGVYDSGMSSNYCEENNYGCVVSTSQYTSVKGPLTYQNWEVGEPNNLVLLVDKNPDGTPVVQPLGEHWGLIGMNGKWGDYGNHGNTYYDPFKTSFIIEFDSAPTCNGAVDNSDGAMPEAPFCIADANGDGTGQPSEINQCTASTTGYICNADQSQCLPKYENALCLYGGLINGSRDMCQKDGAISCPADYTFDTKTDLCTKPVVCKSGQLDATKGGCVAQWTPKCLNPYQLIANLCQDAPHCPDGYVYDPAQDRCGKAVYQCPYNGYLLARVDYDSCPRCYDKARHDITCNTNGTYFVDLYFIYKSNGAREVTAAQKTIPAVPGQSLPLTFIGNPGNGCSYPLYMSQSCNSSQCTSTFKLQGSTCNGGDYAVSTTNNIPFQYSYTSASCLLGGLLNKTTDKCELPVVKDCPIGTTWNETLQVCLGAVDCGTGVIDVAKQACVIPNTINGSTCPDGYSYSPYPIGKCEAVPMCQNGTYTPNATSIPKPFNNTVNHTQWDKCYLGDNTCPAGDQYVCQTVPSKANLNYCSPWSCTDSSGVELFGTTEGSSDKQNDAVVNEQGCMGKIYIFNGKDYRCRADDALFGLTGGGCCDEDKVFLGLVSCKQSEKDLAAQNKKKLCHYVGTYCSKKINLGFTKVCIQHSEGHCCFNSVLARIIQEQGRPQIRIDWGSGESPMCRGFTPEEFEKLDFSRIDFAEFEATLNPNMSTSKVQQLQSNTSAKVQGYNGL